MTQNSTPAPAFRYLGVTDESTVCELCGRTELRRTVILAVLDADGSAESTVRYGTSCAARALSISGGGREVARAAKWATINTLRAARDAYATLERSHAQHAVVVDGAVSFLRPRMLELAAQGVESAAKRVDAIRALAAPIADATAIGYADRAAVDAKLRREGF